MDITPFVYPPNDQEGVEVSPVVSALFGFALDPQTVTKYNAFLIKKTSEYSNNSVSPVEAKVSITRINLADDGLYTGSDYGNNSEAGKKWRSKIEIEPLSALSAHTEYSVVLSKELGSLTVFDPILGVGNAGTAPLFKGPYTGLIADSYEITIQTSGNSSDTTYQWKRLSDNFTSSNNVARKRFLELDQGLFIKFPDAQYYSGDKFTVFVKPLSKINQTIAWNFITGDQSVVKPDDERSDSSVSLPIKDVREISPDIFALVNIEPYDGKTMVKVGSKGSVAINGITITTNKKTNSYNNKRVKILLEDALSLYELNNEIIIEVTETSTHAQVVDLINSSTLELAASSLTPDSLVIPHTSGRLIAGGEPGGFVVFTFNKPIDATVFSESKIRASFQQLDGISEGDLDFSYEIQDNVLKIQL